MIKVLIENEKCLPTRANRWDAGWDLKSNNKTFTIKPGEQIKVHTGVIFEIPPRNVGLVVPRSGHGVKYRVTLTNDIGVIDSEYRGEIFVSLINEGSKDLTIEQFDRFCQMIVMPVNMDSLRVVSKVSETGRGTGGFGSSGVTHEDEQLPELIEPLAILVAKDGDIELEEILEWTENEKD